MYYDVRFETPSRWIIFGSSGSGKTTFVFNLIKSIKLFKNKFNRIVYCTGGVVPNINEINKIKIEYFKNVNEKLINSFNKNKNNLLILDDNMHSFVNDILISDLFTKHSHHKNITVILLMQNLFPKSKFNRDISLNSNYIVLMKNPRDKQQIKLLANQICGGQENYIFDAYKNATEFSAYSYLMLDLNQTTPVELRVRTNVLEKEYPSIVYCENNEKHIKV
jgi:hypothetical protein